jgi:hypothetical protein
MKSLLTIKKLCIVALFAMGVHVAFAAFSITGLSDEKNKNNKFSLRNLSSLSHKSLTFASLKSSLQYKGGPSSSIRETGTGMEINSMLRYDNGNTTYIYPYKFKIKAPKFKTPSPVQH